MKFRPKIGTGDFDTKMRQGRTSSSGEGHKVKVTIMFRGREMAAPRARREDPRRGGRAGRSDSAKVEAMPRQDGRNMTMVLAPDKKAQAARQEGGRRRGRARPRTSGHCRPRVRPVEPGRAPTPPTPTPTTDIESPHAPVARHGTDEPVTRPSHDPERQGIAMPKMKTIEDRRQAVQEDRDRQDPAPQAEPPAPLREEGLHAQAPPRPAWSTCTRATTSKIKRLLAER